MDNSQFQTSVLDSLQNLKQDIQSVKEDVQDLKQDFRDMKQDIRDLRSDLKGLENRMDDGFTEVRREREIDRKKLEDVYQARNTVKIKFGWQWSLASFVLAIMAAGITQVFD